MTSESLQVQIASGTPRMGDQVLARVLEFKLFFFGSIATVKCTYHAALLSSLLSLQRTKPKSVKDCLYLNEVMANLRVTV